jgi:XRE family transcriptional regulator, regulator of sulfur utilization
MLDQTSVNLAENIKRLREARNLTQHQLASVSGVPRPTLANLESGAANPTLSVMIKVASALRVSIEDLIGPARSRTKLYPAARLPTRQRGGATVKQLLPEPIPAMEINRLELASGGRLASSAHTPGTREYLICESGELHLDLTGESMKLGPGDVASLSGDARHAYVNRNRKPAVAYSVVVLAPLGIQ